MSSLEEHAPGRRPLTALGTVPKENAPVGGSVPVPVARSGDGAPEEGLKRRNLIFCICAVALFMGSMDSTIVATAIPRIGRELHSRLNWTGWTITIYGLGQIIAMPIAGRISDQFGRKKIFLICTGLFTVSSLTCGLSTSIFMLIPLRFIQALGGGAFMPSATGIVADHFGANRDRAIGMFSSINPIGGIVGPVFGGIIAQYWSWRGIFFINVPIGVTLIVVALRIIPRSATRPTERFDVAGMSLLIGTLLTFMFSITLLGEAGSSPVDPKVIVPAAFAVGCGWLFIRHIKRSESPFIPIRFLAERSFLTMDVLNLLYGTAVFGFAALAPLYAENRYHVPIASAGTLMSARAVGSIIVAAGSAMMLRRTGYRLPMVIGFLTIAAGLVMLAIAPRGLPPYWWLTLFSLLAGLGLGCAAPASNNASLQLAPGQVAAITGLRGMFRQSGGILYVSIATSVLARSASPGMTQAHIFLVQALILTIMVGLVRFVPDHRGTW